MAAFGYFHTESSHHASEYLPYFRKNPQLVNDFIPQRWDYYEICAAFEEDDRTQDLLGQLKRELKPSVEYGALIIHSMETGQPRVVYGNVANRGLISNLPEGCCVEVPCLVDGNGLQPTAVGALPPQCAAVNLTNVNVQALAVRAALEQNPAHIFHAVMLDPLTGALLTLEQIRLMVGEMLHAEAQWLPLFAMPSETKSTAGSVPRQQKLTVHNQAKT